MSCQGHWPMESHVQLHHNLQKILWLRLVWAKLWGAMPGMDHLFPWKAHKERGKEGPGKTKPFSTQGLLIQRGCRCAAVAKNSVRLFPCFLLQLPNLTLWLAGVAGHQEHGTIRCSHPGLHTLLHFFWCLTWQQRCERKGFGKVIFQPSRFQILPASGGTGVCVGFKSHRIRWFKKNSFKVLDSASYLP